jgi:hypothetical protein
MMHLFSELARNPRAGRRTAFVDEVHDLFLRPGAPKDATAGM